MCFNDDQVKNVALQFGKKVNATSCDILLWIMPLGFNGLYIYHMPGVLN